MNEPNTEIVAARTQRIYVLKGERLIVTAARAAALAGFVQAVKPPSVSARPVPEDRMLRPRQK